MKSINQLEPNLAMLTTVLDLINALDHAEQSFKEIKHPNAKVLRNSTKAVRELMNAYFDALHKANGGL